MSLLVVVKADSLSVLFEYLIVPAIFEYCPQLQEVVSARLGRSEVVVEVVVVVVVEVVVVVVVEVVVVVLLPEILEKEQDQVWVENNSA